MYDIVVRADLVDGYSEILDKSIKSSAFSDFSEQNDYICSFYKNKHSDDYLQTITEHNKQKDEEEFRTIYCLGCIKFPWFRRKKLSLSQSISSFQNKDLDLSMRMKQALKILVD
jgi:hypothetical protein